MIKNYLESIKYLEGFIDFGLFNRIDPKTPVGDKKLDRIRVFLKKIGNPDLDFPSIIVSGTSGKGSTSYFMANILANSDYRVGLTISPHLQKMNERMQLGMFSRFPIFNLQFPKKNSQNKSFINPISDQEFIALLNSIYPQLEEMKNEKEGNLSFPEILFCMALKYFSDNHVDIIICEVGLEGRYDFSNILNPLGFVLTNISLDHTQILGDTVEKIAEEATFKIENLKSSLLFKLQPFVVSGVSQESIIELIKKRAKISKSKVNLLHKDFDYEIFDENDNGVRFGFKSKIIDQKLKKITDFFVSMRGKYQAENASLAIETVLFLKKFGFKTEINVIKNALAGSFFPGRFEVIENNPKIILDGAHNVAKISSFLNSLKKLYPKNPKIFVIAFKKGKDIEEMLKMIKKISDVIIFTNFESAIDFGKNMSEEIDKLKVIAEGDEKYNFNKKGENVFYEKESKKAVEKAVKIASQVGNDSVIIVTGSLYLVGEVREDFGF